MSLHHEEIRMEELPFLTLEVVNGEAIPAGPTPLSPCLPDLTAPFPSVISKVPEGVPLCHSHFSFLTPDTGAQLLRGCRHLRDVLAEGPQEFRL